MYRQTLIKVLKKKHNKMFSKKQKRTKKKPTKINEKINICAQKKKGKKIK